MKQFWISIKIFMWLSFIVGGAYPLAVTGIAYLFMHEKAQGSMVVHEGKIRGSRLIGQKFNSNLYFWSRPSQSEYNPLQSGGSNLSPSSLTLQKLVVDRAALLTASHGVNTLDKIPAELLFASGSGLDPHISLDAAYFQVDRILNSRGVDLTTGREALQQLIKDNTINRYIGFLAVRYVNVLELNMALDETFKVKKDG